MRLLFVVGTRPEIIKLYPLMREAERSKCGFDILYTSQHTGLNKFLGDTYRQFLLRSYGASEFFVKLPFRYRKSSSLTRMSMILQGIEKVVKKIRVSVKYDYLVVQGDTHSVLAGAMYGYYNSIPVVHVEAGLRTHTREPFPEEMNRKLVDQLSSYCFPPCEQDFLNLKEEGCNVGPLKGGVGNTAIDQLVFTLRMGFKKSFICDVLITLHRTENKDHLWRFANAIRTLTFRDDLSFVWIKHPSISNREYKQIKETVLRRRVNFSFIDPLSYVDMVSILASSKLVISDSGGLQEECCYLKLPNIIARQTTERPNPYSEVIGPVANVNFFEKLIYTFKCWSRNPCSRDDSCEYFGNGTTSEKIMDVLQRSK